MVARRRVAGSQLLVVVGVWKVGVVTDDGCVLVVGPMRGLDLRFTTLNCSNFLEGAALDGKKLFLVWSETRPGR